MFELFDSNFSDEWVFNYSLDEQEDILLDAICNNKLIVQGKERTVRFLAIASLSRYSS